MEESKKRRGCENRKALKNREDQEKMEALDDNVPDLSAKEMEALRDEKMRGRCAKEGAVFALQPQRHSYHYQESSEPYFIFFCRLGRRLHGSSGSVSVAVPCCYRVISF